MVSGIVPYLEDIRRHIWYCWGAMYCIGPEFHYVPSFAPSYVRLWSSSDIFVHSHRVSHW